MPPDLQRKYFYVNLVVPINVHDTALYNAMQTSPARMRAGSRNSDMEATEALPRAGLTTNRGNATAKTPPIQPPLVVQLSV